MSHWEYSKKEMLILGPIIVATMAVGKVKALGHKIKKAVKGKKADQPPINKP